MKPKIRSTYNLLPVFYVALVYRAERTHRNWTDEPINSDFPSCRELCTAAIYETRAWLFWVAELPCSNSKSRRNSAILRQFVHEEFILSLHYKDILNLLLYVGIVGPEMQRFVHHFSCWLILV